MTNHSFKAGASRDQASLLPPRIEDYVAADNPVRAIEAYVAALDLVQLGFGTRGAAAGSGQPPYDPADLLKLYLYGYLNRIRSSRAAGAGGRAQSRTDLAAARLAPGYRTIAKFRKENWAALKAVNRDFVLLLRELDLVGGDAGGDRRGVFRWRRQQGEHRDAQAAGGSGCGA